jgi:hypothetical protein
MNILENFVERIEEAEVIMGLSEKGNFIKN